MQPWGSALGRWQTSAVHVRTQLVGKRDALNPRALRDQPLLNLLVPRRRLRIAPLLVVEVLPADHRLGIVARRKPPSLRRRRGRPARLRLPSAALLSGTR